MEYIYGLICIITCYCFALFRSFFAAKFHFSCVQQKKSQGKQISAHAFIFKYDSFSQFLNIYRKERKAKAFIDIYIGKGN